MSTPFIHPLTITPADIDELDHVNNVVYIRWVQEVAEAHWRAMTSPDFRQQYRWVVLRHEIDYRFPAKLSDAIAGSTWVGTYFGAKFDRFVKLHSPDRSKVFAEAKTTWCLLDGGSGKPLRIPPAILNIL